MAAGLAVAGLGGLLLAACTSASATGTAPASCAPGGSRLTVQGSGLATGTPDLLTLTVDVNVTGPTAQAALADNSTRTAALSTALLEAGTAQKDIQTTNVSVQPNEVLVHGTMVLAGYTVDNTVVAKLRDFARAGAAIDAATAAAGDATRIDSLSFSIEDPRGLQDRARQDAVHQAVSHAGSMAAAAGERLGPVCSLTDDTSVSPGPYLGNDGVAFGAQAAASPVPVQPGTQQANAQVTLVYALRAR